MTASGSSQLSYCAARNRNTNTTDGDEHVDRGVAGELLLVGELGPFEGEAVGQHLGREALHGGDRLAGARSRAAVAPCTSAAG